MTSIVISTLDVDGAPSQGRSTHLTLRGTLDAATADQVRTAVRRAVDHGVRQAVFELAELRFIDSRGLAALIEADRLLPGGATLVGSRGVVRRVLQVAALEPPLHRGDEAGRPIAQPIVDDAARP